MSSLDSMPSIERQTEDLTFTRSRIERTMLSKQGLELYERLENVLSSTEQTRHYHLIVLLSDIPQSENVLSFADKVALAGLLNQCLSRFPKMRVAIEGAMARLA